MKIIVQFNVITCNISFPFSVQFVQCPDTLIKVGDVGEAGELGTTIALKTIWKEDETFMCGGSVVRSGTLTYFYMSGPTQKIAKTVVPELAKDDRKILEEAKRNSLQACLNRCEIDFAYRKMVMLGHIRQLRRQEVLKALQNKSRKRVFWIVSLLAERYLVFCEEICMSLTRCLGENGISSNERVPFVLLLSLF